MDLQAPLTLPVLAALLFAAVLGDLRTRRIPNALVCPARLAGVLGWGLFSPLYALRVMGAM